MIDETKELQKLAQIQKKLIDPAMIDEKNVDVIIKIRDGIIVWAETNSLTKISVNFKL